MAVDRRESLEDRTRRLIRHQQAAISFEQLMSLGWTVAEIKSRVRRDEWHREHRGVYIAGDPALLPLARHSAALLSLAQPPRSITAPASSCGD